jgi:hypothetical protein
LLHHINLPYIIYAVFNIYTLKLGLKMKINGWHYAMFGIVLLAWLLALVQMPPFSFL